ncbi:hypothetical protein [Methylobacterium radiotolerans]|uniref:hypothetical protein n=1 Tax=Methylobacterium radiotolerans TaxID=31998 RepID=UPI00399C4B35
MREQAIQNPGLRKEAGVFLARSKPQHAGKVAAQRDSQFAVLRHQRHLQTAIKRCIAEHNQRARPFVRTTPATHILAAVSRSPELSVRVSALGSSDRWVTEVGDEVYTPREPAWPFRSDHRPRIHESMRINGLLESAK